MTAARVAPVADSVDPPVRLPAPRRRRTLGALSAATAAVVVAIVSLSGTGGRVAKASPGVRRPTPRLVIRPAAPNPRLGAAFSPAHFPGSSESDVEAFFDRASELGGHVVLIMEWAAETPLSAVREISRRTREAGLRFHLYLSPIALDSLRQRPAIPPDVPGSSFRDASVRSAFQAAVLDLAGVEPDLLGLGTEVNFLAENPVEFDAYATMTRDTAAAVRARYPGQALTVSFQWDVMLRERKFAPLDVFRDWIDVFAFTTYPDGAVDPAALPADYYAAIRAVLPTERVGLAEVGWSAADAAAENAQAAFYARLPEMTRTLGPEFISIALLHDVDVFRGDLEPLNHVGVRYRDGRPKEAWYALRAGRW